MSYASDRPRLSDEEMIEAVQEALDSLPAADRGAADERRGPGRGHATRART